MLVNITGYLVIMIIGILGIVSIYATKDPFNEYSAKLVLMNCLIIIPILLYWIKHI